MGFEPTRAEHNGLAVHRLHHSATSSPAPAHIWGFFFSLWSTGCKPTDDPSGCSLYSWAVRVSYVPACRMAGGNQGSGSFVVHLSLSISPSVPVFRG